MTKSKGSRPAVRKNEGWSGIGGKKNRVPSMIAKALAIKKKRGRK